MAYLDKIQIQGTTYDIQDSDGRKMIATPYESQTYPVAVGAYCIYDNKLYRCNTAISTSETWTAAHWTEAKVGDEVASLKSALYDTTGTQPITFTEGKYVNTGVSVGSTVDQTMVDNASWRCAIVDCSEGDSFVLNLKGGNSPRAWCFVDSDSKALSVATNGVVASGLFITAPANASKLILNDNNRGAKASYKHPIKEVYNRIEKDEGHLSDLQDQTDFVFNGISLPVSSTGVKYQKFAILSGHVYTVENRSNQICAVYTGNTTSGDTVQTVSVGLAAGKLTKFTASANANYIRVYFSSTPSGNIVCYDNVSELNAMADSIPTKKSNANEYQIARNNATNSNGITYSWNGDACTVTGTATALSYISLAGSASTIPDGMEKGKEYQILFDGVVSEIRIYPSYNGTSLDTDHPVIITKRNARFTIPSDATGIQVWLSVNNGSVVSETVHPYLMNTWSNQELAKEAEIIYRSNYFKTGKTLVTLGDSIFGNNADSGTGVPDFIAAHSDLTVINAAFGGTRMVKRSNDITVSRCSFDFENLVDAIIDNDFSAQEQTIEDNPSDILPYYSDRLTALSNINWDTVDYVTINYGTNDWEAGTSTDDYITAYEETLTKFMTEFPHIRVFVVTPTFRFWINAQHEVTDDSNTKTYGSPAKNLPTFSEALQTVVGDLNLNLIDCYHIGINRYNWTHYFSQYDTTHQSVNGRELLGIRLAGQIMSN